MTQSPHPKSHCSLSGTAQSPQVNKNPVIRQDIPRATRSPPRSCGQRPDLFLDWVDSLLDTCQETSDKMLVLMVPQFSLL